MTERYPFFREEDEQTIAVIGEEAVASDLNGTYQKPYAVLTMKRVYCKNETGNYIAEASSLRSAGKVHLPGRNWFLWVALIFLAIAAVFSSMQAWSGYNSRRVNEAQNTINRYDEQRVQLEGNIEAVAELEQLEKSWSEQGYEVLLNEYSAAQEELSAIQNGTYSDLALVRAMALSYRLGLYYSCGSDDPDVISETLTKAYAFAEDYGIDRESVLTKEAMNLAISRTRNPDVAVKASYAITNDEIKAYLEAEKIYREYMGKGYVHEHIIETYIRPGESSYANINILHSETRSHVYEILDILYNRASHGDFEECSAAITGYQKLHQDKTDYQPLFYYGDPEYQESKEYQEYRYMRCLVDDFFYRSCVAYLDGVEELPHSEAELQSLVDGYATRISEAEAINQQIEQYRTALGITSVEDTDQLRLNLQNQLEGLEREYHSAKTVENEVQLTKAISIVLVVTVVLLLILALVHRIKLAVIIGVFSALISLAGWFVSMDGPLTTTALPWLLCPILAILSMLLATIADRRRTIYQIAHTTGSFNFTPSLYPTAELKNFTAQVENLNSKENPYA